MVLASNVEGDHRSFCHRVWIFRLDLLSLLVGWGAETGVILPLWIFHVPFGLRNFFLGVAATVLVWLAFWARYLRGSSWWYEDDLSEADLAELRDRRTISTKLVLSRISPHT